MALTLDREGRLILCQHGDRRVARLDSVGRIPKPKYVTIADRYEGKRFNSPNDAVVAFERRDLFHRSAVWAGKGMRMNPKKELSFQGVYRISPDGKVTLLTKELEAPERHRAFAGRERRFTWRIRTASGSHHVARPIKADGTLGEAREIFNAQRTHQTARPGSCDGLTVDQERKRVRN